MKILVNKTTKHPSQSRSRDRGATMVEYSLLVALIAVVSLVSVNTLGSATGDRFQVVAGELGAEDSDGGSEDESSGEVEDADDSGDIEDDSDDESADAGDDADDESGDTGDDSGDESDDESDDPEGDDGDDRDEDSSDPGDDDSGVSSDVEETPDEDPVVPGSTVATASASSSFYWWNSSKHGGEGAWKAAVSYANEWIRHQYLTLEITRVDEDGAETTSTVNNFYVPAQGSSTFDLWDNSLKINKGKSTGVVSVKVKVTAIKTSDESWQTVTYSSDGPSTVVDAPSP